MKKLLLLFLMPLFLLGREKEPIEECKLLNIGVGVFNIVRNTKAVNFQIEYRSDFPFYRNSMLFFRPLIGVMGTTQGSGYIYTGIGFDVFFHRKDCLHP